MSKKFQIYLGALSLIGLLAYTFVHTGTLLARYVDPGQVGFVAAFGIESAIVSLSLRIGDLRRRAQNYGFFLFTLIAVVVVSALANISEGFHTYQKFELTIQTVSALDVIQAIIGLSATGLISLIVLALSEIIGTDVEAVVQANERRRQKEQKSIETNTAIIPIESARQADLDNDRMTREQAEQAILAAYVTDPNTPPHKIYRPLGISRTSFYTYQNSMIKDGIIHKNGNGFEVCTR